MATKVFYLYRTTRIEFREIEPSHNCLVIFGSIETVTVLSININLIL